MMKKMFFLILSLWFIPVSVESTQLYKVQIIDKSTVVVTFREGEIVFRDDAKGASAYLSDNDPTENSLLTFGRPLPVDDAVRPSNWKIYSDDDPAYGADGLPPATCYRKSKINGMGQFGWVESLRDYNYQTPLDHEIYLVLPQPLKDNCKYTILIAPETESDKTCIEIVFDIFNTRSGAIHTNIVGYMPTRNQHAADVYSWMGDGGARDYSSFVGNKVYLYNTDTKEKREAGKLDFWKENGRDVGNYDFTKSPVWKADFATDVPEGNYRLVIEGIGSSDDFQVKETIYKAPYDISVKGFYYMRIGEDCMECVPVPRRPLYIPGVSPENTTIYITTMSPFHKEWKTFSRGDYWDNPNDWKPYKKPGSPINTKATGGHSDALDWDRHLGHVSIIYDMLLPYYVTKGNLPDDDCGIPESGNGIPDILDEARNEVDFWLSLRDGEGYSHGLTNPNRENELYQAGTTVIAAWANAANAAMLAACFRLAGNNPLMNRYLDSAKVAFSYALKQADQMLEASQDMGSGNVRGKDLKMMAAVFLYDLTGDTTYEDCFAGYCEITGDESVINDKDKNQLWAVAGYLFTGRKVRYPDLYSHIKASVIYQAHQKEADNILIRPSRRGTDNAPGYNHTAQHMHRTMLAHAITEDLAEKDFFLKALVSEADWGLGRNPLNLIQMTTATTTLGNKKSVVNIYTTGRNDGSPGMHPGHTPYMNIDNWAPGMIMGRPSWMYNQSHPADVRLWPRGELYFETRYVWTHSEFTPQQTMRGKMALYGYLYARKN
ncbi:MAG: glycoside hydrolase family 9 protein [Tannerellaceae bacterium]|jgi:hypothetical protein|nr:glycoside hydrolase family 9 protein [Tannerellaceae bacterium]